MVPVIYMAECPMVPGCQAYGAFKEVVEDNESAGWAGRVKLRCR